MGTRRDTQKAKTRERLYETAMQLFLRRGFDCIVVDDIVRASKVAHGTFYFHFSTKDDVLLEAVRRAERRSLAGMETTRARPIREVLGAAMVAFAKEWEGKRSLWPHAGAVALGMIGAEERGRGSAPLRLALAASFERASDERELTSALPPQMLADLFLLDFFAALMTWSASGDPLDVVLPGVVELFLRGVKGVGKG